MVRAALRVSAAQPLLESALTDIAEDAGARAALGAARLQRFDRLDPAHLAAPQAFETYFAAPVHARAFDPFQTSQRYTISKALSRIPRRSRQMVTGSTDGSLQDCCVASSRTAGGLLRTAANPGASRDTNWDALLGIPPPRRGQHLSMVLARAHRRGKSSRRKRAAVHHFSASAGRREEKWLQPGAARVVPGDAQRVAVPQDRRRSAASRAGRNKTLSRITER